MISVLETEQLYYCNMTALANLVWAVLHLLLQQWNHNIVKKIISVNKWMNQETWMYMEKTKSKCKGHQKHLSLKHIFLMIISVIFRKRKLGQEIAKSHQITLVHYLCEWLHLLSVFSAITMNIIVSFFLGQNLGTIMHGLLPGHLKQILCLLSLGISVSTIGQRHIK